jgi:hypothetical protein
MTTYNWSSLTNNQSITFDPTKDKLVFDDPAITASLLSVNFGINYLDMTTSSLSYGGKTIKLTVSVKSLTTTNVTANALSPWRIGCDLALPTTYIVV